MAGAIGSQVPVYDISLHYKSSDSLHSLLVTEPHTGAALAAGFHPGTLVSKTTNLLKNFVTSTPPQPPAFPSCPVVLMRGHGFTCVGSRIEEAVYRAIFTCSNARIQTTALLMQGQYNMGLMAEHFGSLGVKDGGSNPGPAKQEGIKYLAERECKDSWTAIERTVDRPWGLWCREVEPVEGGLYRNAYLEDGEEGEGGEEDDGVEADDAEHEK